MVDEGRVLRLLRGVTDTTGQLVQEQAASEERRADPLWLPGIKYLMISAVEGCIDVAQHICGSQGWGPPADNGDAMLVLGRSRVLDDALAGRMRTAVGFRNVLVHEYVRVDDGIVVSRLADLSDISAFVAQVADWIASEGEAASAPSPR